MNPTLYPTSPFLPLWHNSTSMTGRHTAQWQWKRMWLSSLANHVIDPSLWALFSNILVGRKRYLMWMLGICSSRDSRSCRVMRCRCQEATSIDNFWTSQSSQRDLFGWRRRGCIKADKRLTQKGYHCEAWAWGTRYCGFNGQRVWFIITHFSAFTHFQDIASAKRLPSADKKKSKKEKQKQKAAPKPKRKWFAIR